MSDRLPGLTVRTLPGRWQALGAAAHFLSRREPFAQFPAAALMRTLSGQIERGHCLFALEGNRVVGFFGWALYDAADAQRFAETGKPPDDSRAHGKDVVWVLTAAVAGAEALLPLYRAVREMYPGRRIMAIRHKGGGRRALFDRMLRPG